MPQMNRATLICISFYFHSLNCDESTVSFIIKFNCGGGGGYIDRVNAAVWPLDFYASVCVRAHCYFFWQMKHFSLTPIVPTVE